MSQEREDELATSTNGEDRTEARNPVSRVDAVRRTLAAGIVDNRDGVKYVHVNFGHTMTPACFSAFKSQMNDRARVRENPEDGTRAATEDAVNSKTHAVRIAILEGFSEPKKGVEYIKSRFGIEVDPAYFAVLKSRFARRGELARRDEKPAVSDEAFDDLATVRNLVRRLGAEQVRRMVGLFE